MHLEKKSFKVWNPKKEYTHVYRFQSWYSPIFLKSNRETDADNSTCITFDVCKDKEGKHFLLIANILPPAPIDSHEVMIHVVNLNNDFTNNTLKQLPSLHNQHCVVVPANDNINNIFTHQLLLDNVPIRRLFIETNGINIEGLLHHAIKVLRQNRFYLMPHKIKSTTLRDIDRDFYNIVSTYPDIESYALAYAWAQGLVYADKFLYIFDDRKAVDKKPFNHGYGVERG